MAALAPEHESPPAPPPLPTNQADISRTDNNAPPSNRSKLKPFGFCDTYDMHLLKAVRSVDAHIPEWGKSEALFEEVRKLFIREIPSSVFVHSQAPSSKTLADRFKRVVARRRDELKRTGTASGIVELYGDKEVLLDDLIAEIDEKDEAARAEKEELKESERRLVVAGEQIREMALKRRGGSEGGSETVDTAAEGEARSAKKRCRRKEGVISDDDITSSMIEQAALRQEMEQGRLELEKERIQIEQSRSEREVERFNKMHETTTRRLDLDEKRFAVEVEERKQSLFERKKMVDVMELLCKKLQ